MPHCPECKALVDVEQDEVDEGQILSCPECAVDLEVVSTNPLELELVEDEDEEVEEEFDEEEMEKMEKEVKEDLRREETRTMITLPRILALAALLTMIWALLFLSWDAAIFFLLLSWYLMWLAEHSRSTPPSPPKAG